MPLVIERLDPQFVFASGKALHRTWCYSPFCSLKTRGLGPPAGFPADDSAIWAGYSNWVDGGTFEGESLDWVFRGGVQFDLERFRLGYGKDSFLLLNAVLLFAQQEPHGPCDTSLYLASGDWAHGSLDEYLVATTGTVEDYVDTIPPADPSADGFEALVGVNVLGPVLGWISGERPNRGFCFVGSDESLAEDSDAACINQFGLFKLELSLLTVAGGATAKSLKQRLPHPSQRRVQTLVSGRLPKRYQERMRHPGPRPPKPRS